MRRVTLIGTDIQTTALGFGTAALSGNLSERESTELLEVAYACGIRHFDTAPLYGYGDCEAVLGKFLRRRPDATVATKFGLTARGFGSTLVRNAKRIARPLLTLRPQLRASAGALVRAGSPRVSNFDPRAAATSLVTSLRHLRRERIELLLLHECRRGDIERPELLDFLYDSQARGLIGAFGIATDFATVQYCIESAPQYAKVVQFANNREQPNLEALPALARDVACITHTPFGGMERTARPADSAPAALRYAVEQNSNGIVLFSSQKVQHIIDNIRSVEQWSAL